MLHAICYGERLQTSWVPTYISDIQKARKTKCSPTSKGFSSWMQDAGA